MRPGGDTLALLASLLGLVAVSFRSRHCVRFALFTTSTQSRVRLEAALRTACARLGVRCVAVQSRPNFVWSTRVVDAQQADCPHRWSESKAIFNHVAGATSLEDKYDLALFAGPECNVESIALASKSDVERWGALCTREPPRRYILKDAKANGGHGLWLFEHPAPSASSAPSSAFDAVVTQLSSKASYVLQEYVSPPLLWHGRKFHFRIIGVLTAAGDGFLHRRAFVHPANKPYDPGAPDDDVTVHLTNLCVNFAHKDSGDFVGEVVEDLVAERPLIFAQCLAIWARVIDACDSLFAVQRHCADFEYCGVDFLADASEGVHLLEVNCPPGIVSPTGLPAAEALHDELLVDTLAMCVVAPLAGKQPAPLGGFVRAPRTAPTRIREVATLQEARACSALARLIRLRRLRKRGKGDAVQC